MHVRYKSLYISLPSSTKQERELDDQVLRCLRNVDDDDVFPFGIERRRYMRSCSTFLGPLAHRTDLDNREFDLLNSFLTRRCPPCHKLPTVQRFSMGVCKSTSSFT